MTLHFSPLSGVFRSRRGSGGVLPGRIVVERAVAVPVLVGGVGLLGGALGLGAFVTRVGAEQTGELALEVTIGRRHTMWLSDVAHLIDLALSPVAAVLVTVVVAWLVARRNVVAGVVVAVAIGGGWLVAGATKLLFLRLRPPMETVRALVSEVGTTSFPSGHTAFACSLLAAMVLLVRMWGRSSAWVWVVGVPVVLGVGASRLYLGAHYLGDVVASPLLVAGVTLSGVGLVSLFCGGRRVV